MKNYTQLTKAEQKFAVDKLFHSLIEAVCEGAVCFNDKANDDDLQKRIDKCLAKAEAKQTPWFASEYLLDDAVVHEALKGMAQCRAEDALYSEPNEDIVANVIKQ